MRFWFDVQSNHSIPYINTVTIRLKNGREIVLDRNTTEWYKDEKDGTVNVMMWKEPYEWDGEDELQLPDPKLFKGAKLVDYEIEDDAPEDYEFEILTCQLVSDEADLDIEVDLVE